MATFGDLKSLGSSNLQLAASVGAIYTAPSGKKAQIGSIWLHNTNTSAETVEIYLRNTSAGYRREKISLAANESYEIAPKVPWCLSGSETLNAVTTTASKVNCEITGREEA